MEVDMIAREMTNNSSQQLNIAKKDQARVTYSSNHFQTRIKIEISKEMLHSLAVEVNVKSIQRRKVSCSTMVS